jgi:osmotically-inducible protein OsmY
VGGAGLGYYSGQGGQSQAGYNQGNFGQGGSAEFGGYGQSWRGQQQGRGFRGRGPRGYQRSDERLEEEVNQALMDDDDIDADEVQVEVSNGEVTLTGTVADRQQKRCAEDCAERVSGVTEVQNHLRVRREDSSRGRSGETSKSQSASSSSGTGASASKK